MKRTSNRIYRVFFKWIDGRNSMRSGHSQYVAQTAKEAKRMAQKDDRPYNIFVTKVEKL